MDDFLEGYSEQFLHHVHFTGFVDNEDLSAVYKLAKVFVFPSSYEGFGIPPLEALACGTPVISSDAASMPEVLRKQALFFHNNDYKDLSKLLIDVKKKQYYIPHGLDNYQKLIFRYSSSAKKIIMIFNQEGD